MNIKQMAAKVAGTATGVPMPTKEQLAASSEKLALAFKDAAKIIERGEWEEAHQYLGAAARAASDLRDRLWDHVEAEKD